MRFSKHKRKEDNNVKEASFWENQSGQRLVLAMEKKGERVFDRDNNDNYIDENFDEKDRININTFIDIPRRDFAEKIYPFVIDELLKKIDKASDLGKKNLYNAATYLEIIFAKKYESSLNSGHLEAKQKETFYRQMLCCYQRAIKNVYQCNETYLSDKEIWAIGLKMLEISKMLAQQNLTYRDCFKSCYKALCSFSEGQEEEFVLPVKYKNFCQTLSTFSFAKTSQSIFTKQKRPLPPESREPKSTKMQRTG